MSNVGESGSILVDSLFAGRYQLARVLGGGGWRRSIWRAIVSWTGMLLSRYFPPLCV